MSAPTLLLTLLLALVAGCTLDFDESLLEDGGADGADAAADCGAGRSSCAGTCVDLSTSKRNCGDCGNECPGNQSCCDGDCRGNCP